MNTITQGYNKADAQSRAILDVKPTEHQDEHQKENTSVAPNFTRAQRVDEVFKDLMTPPKEHLVPSIEQYAKHRQHEGQPEQFTSSSPRIGLEIVLRDLPAGWGTSQIYQALENSGNISHINILERGKRITVAVTFKPAPPARNFFPGKIVSLKDDSRNAIDVLCVKTRPICEEAFMREISIPVECADVGVMEDSASFLSLAHLQTTSSEGLQLTFDFQEDCKGINFQFPIMVGMDSSTHPTRARTATRVFRMHTPVTQIQEFVAMVQENNSAVFLMTLKLPPQVHRKTDHAQNLHDQGGRSNIWTEARAWYRQTDIEADPSQREHPIGLAKVDAVIDFGRWLTYRLVFNPETVASEKFKRFCDALNANNVPVFKKSGLNYRDGDTGHLWAWCAHVKNQGNRPHLASQEMLDSTVHLHFATRYQLEVCLSQGILHECNMTADFLDQLAKMDRRAVNILEKVADTKAREFDLRKIVHMRDSTSALKKEKPQASAKILSATVTPSTIYFSTPIVETSNRVIRQFCMYEDRFMRVKFTDEKYRGRIFAAPGDTNNEVFSRIKRCVDLGITVGGRRYDFLAFGNSQFREHGAYFFASTNTLNVNQIRDWMGNFANIKVIPKYVSRLGQCFSTTKAINHRVDIERIQDVNRNGFCFTDGVGRISSFLAFLIGSHYNPVCSEQHCPTTFQFRLGGCKGVLAVDPSLKGKTIQIRPSQEKFPAMFNGLEICRSAEFATANLNIQLILILSALGVPDGVFLKKLRLMLYDLQMAMTDNRKASAMLQKYTDPNHTTVTLATMVYHGFMDAKEPFFMSCLRLWRCWHLKYLKEKARIPVGKSAFLLGCTDETGILQGSFDAVTSLPEIFLQIPDPDAADGQFKVVEGTCVLARNPSLHPGDVRVVRAIDVPSLRHLKNCVVFPQTGDRDLPSMCSGGDLDGDDFVVSWDNDLLPTEWNYTPMNYTAPTPVESKGPVTVDDMTSFFVDYIKNDNLGRIAVNHRYWADYLDAGVKDTRCLKLAQLHSQAVDYNKTGVPAILTSDLDLRLRPHWAEAKVQPNRIYHSEKIIGQLYDEVKAERFVAAPDISFDKRILNACVVSKESLRDAGEVKTLYDAALGRIREQFGIATEFEIVTTFVMSHDSTFGDYKLGETLGEVSRNLRQEFREKCFAKAGVDSRTRDWVKLKPFLVAMYTVTANEIQDVRLVDRDDASCRPREQMPKISFPWIFPMELGQIAVDALIPLGGAPVARPLPIMPTPSSSTDLRTPPASRPDASPVTDVMNGDQSLHSPHEPRGNNKEITIAEAIIHEGHLLDLFHGEA